jgi:hypothetical protein
MSMGRRGFLAQAALVAVGSAASPRGRGDPPQTTARDCARAVTLVFDAYRKAGEK